MRPSEQAARAAKAPNSAVAQRNFERIAQVPQASRESIERRLDFIHDMKASAQAKQVRLIKLVDEVAAVIAKHSPCRRGCDACCQFPVIIFESEARRIGKAIRRAPVAVAWRPPDQMRAAAQAFNRVPCPFLRNHQCTIYADRPLSCRQHHSLDDGPEQCAVDLPPEDSYVPKYGPMAEIELAYGLVLALNGEAAGDIREFFPSAP